MKIERIQIPPPVVRSVEQAVREESGMLDVDAVRFEEQSAGRRRREESAEKNQDFPGTPRRDGADGSVEHSRDDGLKARAHLDIVA
jgi:hypothetical protein